jgi:hypothetical protein
MGEEMEMEMEMEMETFRDLVADGAAPLSSRYHDCGSIKRAKFDAR